MRRVPCGIRGISGESYADVYENTIAGSGGL